MTVPSTRVRMSAWEKFSPKARPALPSEKMPVSASASDVVLPLAVMLAVSWASMWVPVATVTSEVALASLTASASAICAAPGFCVLSISRSVDAFIAAVASAVAVMTTAAPEVMRTPVWMSMRASASARV